MSGDTPHWYDNAVVYAVDVEAFQDADGDGTGDFRGLTDRLDYLTRLGVDCVWLLPFYPSPHRDNGYDVADYYGVDPQYGTLGDFVEFVRAAEERGIHVLLDLVVNHTSDQHPWFQAARADPDSAYRDYYVWSEDPPEPGDEGQIFPGEVADDRVWTYDEDAGAYYYHRFYPFQPDLDLSNPAVREEFRRIVGFWLRTGVSGFRVDAAGLTTREKRPGRPDPEDPYEFLRELRSYADGFRNGVVLLAEADDDLDTLGTYFGSGGGMDLMLNFLLSAAAFHALAVERAAPLARCLATLPEPPAGCQWVNFLRNYDELNLGRLDEAEREATFGRFAPDEAMRIYGRGIRRRLAPMLGDDRRWLELVFSLLFSTPGAPLLTYGDEIGMGDDLSLPGRDAVRTPMQWSPTENAGFSSAPADELTCPVIDEGPFGYGEVNVADQWADEDSLLAFVTRLVGVRHEVPEVGLGEYAPLEVEPASVFAHRFDRDGDTVAMAHNLADEPRTVQLELDYDGGTLIELLGDADVDRRDDGCELALDGYGYQWLRIDQGAGDGGRSGAGVGPVAES